MVQTIGAKSPSSSAREAKLIAMSQQLEQIIIMYQNINDGVE